MGSSTATVSASTTTGRSYDARASAADAAEATDAGTAHGTASTGPAAGCAAAGAGRSTRRKSGAGAGEVTR